MSRALLELDLSYLTDEERRTIEEVLRRQREDDQRNLKVVSSSSRRRAYIGSVHPSFSSSEGEVRSTPEYLSESDGELEQSAALSTGRLHDGLHRRHVESTNRKHERSQDHRHRHREAASSIAGSVVGHASSRQVYQPQQDGATNELTSQRRAERFLRGSSFDNAHGGSRHSPALSSIGGDSTTSSTAISNDDGTKYQMDWQTSSDGKCNLGRFSAARHGRTADSGRGGILGVKVVGGQMTQRGRVGAIVSKVKRGSPADSVARLRPGDEIISWNGINLQGLSYEQVYSVMDASRQGAFVELMVRRNIPGGSVGGGGTDAVSSNFSNQLHPAVGNSNARCGSISVPSTPPVSSRFHRQQQYKSLQGPRTTQYPVTTLPSQPSQPESDLETGRLRLRFRRPDRSQLIVNVISARDLVQNVPSNSQGEENNAPEVFCLLTLLPGGSARRGTSRAPPSWEPRWDESFSFFLPDPLQVAESQSSAACSGIEICVFDAAVTTKPKCIGCAKLTLDDIPFNAEPYWYRLSPPESTRIFHVTAPPPRSQQPVPKQQSVESPNPVKPTNNASSSVASTKKTSSTAASKPVARPKEEVPIVSASDPPVELPNGRSSKISSTSTVSSTEIPSSNIVPAPQPPLAATNSAATTIMGSPAIESPDVETMMARVNSAGGASAPSSGRLYRKHSITTAPSGTSAIIQAATSNSSASGTPITGTAASRRANNLRHQSSQGSNVSGVSSDPIGASSTELSGIQMNDGQTPSRISQHLGSTSDVESMLSVDSAAQATSNDAIALSHRRISLADSVADSVIANDNGASVGAGNDDTGSASDTGTSGPALPGGSVSHHHRRRSLWPAVAKKSIGRLTGNNSFTNVVDAVRQQKEQQQLAKKKSSGVSRCGEEVGANSRATSVSSFGDISGSAMFLDDLGPGQMIGRQCMGAMAIGELEISFRETSDGKLLVTLVSARDLVLKAKAAPVVFAKVALVDGQNAAVERRKSQQLQVQDADPQLGIEFQFDLTPYKDKLLQISLWAIYRRIDKSCIGAVSIRLERLSRMPLRATYKLYDASAVGGLVPSITSDSAMS